MRSTSVDRRGIRGIAIVVAIVIAATLILSLAPVSSAQTIGGSAPLSSSQAQSRSVSDSSGTSPLQTLINSASPGATVYLPRGTYIGQLQIDHSLDVVGAGIGSTILQSPAVMSPDNLGNVFVVEIGDHASVQLSGVTVRVTEQCMLAIPIGVATGGGIGVRDNASLDVWDVKAVAYGPYPDLNQVCTTSTDQPGMLSFGRAISIGLDDPIGDGTNSQDEGHGTITGVYTHGFDIFSISVGGVRGPSFSTATIIGNTVRVGPGPYTAAYGIVVYGKSIVSHNLVTGTAGSDGGIAVVITSAIVTDNVVRNFSCLTAPFPISPPCGVNPLTQDQDLGIFLASITPGTVVEHNEIDNVDAGILVEGPGAPAVVTDNTIRDSTYYGLDLIDANQTFRANVVTGGEYVIAVGAAAANTTAVLLHENMRGYSVGIALLAEISPYVANVVVRSM